jgi:hypothetical protein
MRCTGWGWGRGQEQKSKEEKTHWYSGTSESKSTHSTPISSRLSSTRVARSWSVASSIPRNREDLDGSMDDVDDGSEEERKESSREQ